MTDREKLIELIGQVQYLGGLELALADHLLSNGITFQKWTPVSERLPEDNERVIAYRPNEADASAYKYCVMWGWSVRSSLRHTGISHWMPLPEPPQEK